jgi:hypothetical protein
VLLLAAACGTQTAPSAGSATAAPSKQFGEGPCPQAAPAPGATSCVTNGTVQNQQDNQSFNDRQPLTATGIAEAAPVTRRIRQSLERLSPAERLQVSAVRSALLTSGIYRVDLVVFGGAASAGVAFGGYIVLNTRPPACAWGLVSVKAVDVESGGITREGACLPSAGGH